MTFGGERKPITTEAGFHAGDFAPTGGAFVDRHSDRLTPTSESLCNVDGPCHLFWSTKAMDAYHLRAPEPLEVKGSDGTTLYATILLPEGKVDPASVPLIVNPYGGPAVMTVQNKWGGDGFLFDTLLAQHGFAVLHTDNRGMAGRGREFAQASYHNFGPVQLEINLPWRMRRWRKVPATRCEAAGLVGMELGRHVYALRANAFRSVPCRGSSGCGDRLA